MWHWYVASFEKEGEKKIGAKYLENNTISSQPKDSLLIYEQQFHDCYTQDISYLFLGWEIVQYVLGWEIVTFLTSNYYCPVRNLLTCVLHWADKGHEYNFVATLQLSSDPPKHECFVCPLIPISYLVDDILFLRVMLSKYETLQGLCHYITSLYEESIWLLRPEPIAWMTSVEASRPDS